jgi:hypothetical protein
MRFIILAVLFIQTTSAEAYYGFCAKSVTSGVECTKILNSTSISISDFCATWSAGSLESTVITATTFPITRQKHVENCNYLAGNKKFACFATTTCRGTVHTVPLPPSGTEHAVFAVNAKYGAKECHRHYTSAYAEVRARTPGFCTIGVKVVEVLP